MRIPHLLIEQTTGKQLLMCARCNDISVLNHMNTVTVSHRGQPVVNHQHCFLLHKPGQGTLQHCLALRICIAGRLIQNYDGSIFKHCSRNSNPLPLSSRQVSARSSANGLVSMFKAHNKIVTATLLCGGYDLLIACPSVTHADVIHDRKIEQVIIL